MGAHGEDVASQFGELRSQLERPSSPEAWRALVALLEQWPEPEHLREVVLPYVRGHLEGWDPALRRPAIPWVYAVNHPNAAGEIPPHLRVVADVTLELEVVARALPDARAAQRFRDMLSEVRRLELVCGDGEDEEAVLDALMTAPWARRLEAFTWRSAVMLQPARIVEALCALAASMAGEGALREVGFWFEEGDLTAEVAYEVARLCGSAPLLTRLELSSEMMLDTALASIVQHHGRLPTELSFPYHAHGDALIERLATLCDEPLHALALSNLEGFSPSGLLRLCSSEVMSGSLRQLAFSGAFGRPSPLLSVWSRAPQHLAYLQRLEVQADTVSALDLRRLSRGGAFAHLEALELSFGALGDEGLSWVLRGLNPHIEALDLSHDQAIGAAGVMMLSEAPQLHHLKRLRLDGLDCGAPGVIESLSESRHLSALTALSLNATGLGVRHVARLSHSGALLGRLEQLELTHGTMGDEGVEALCRSPHIGALRELDLSHCELGERAVVALCQAPFAATLEVLRLNHCRLDDRALEVLAAHAEALPRLRELSMRSARTSATGLEALSWSPLARRLHVCEVRTSDPFRAEREVTPRAAISEEVWERFAPWLREALRQQFQDL